MLYFCISSSILDQVTGFIINLWFVLKIVLFCFYFFAVKNEHRLSRRMLSVENVTMKHFLKLWPMEQRNEQYKKRLVWRINRNLLLNTNLKSTWTLQLNKINQIKSKWNYLQKIVTGPASLSRARWLKCLRIALN